MERLRDITIEKNRKEVPPFRIWEEFSKLSGGKKTGKKKLRETQETHKNTQIKANTTRNHKKLKS